MAIADTLVDKLPTEVLTVILQNLIEEIPDILATLQAHRKLLAAADDTFWQAVAEHHWRWRVRLLVGESHREYCRRCYAAIRSQRIMLIGGAPYPDNFGAPYTGYSPWDEYQVDDGCMKPDPQMARPHKILSACAAASDGKILYRICGYDDDEDEACARCMAVDSSTMSELACPDYPQALCFAAADVDASRRLWLTGGGDSIYRGASVSDAVRFLSCSPDSLPIDGIPGDPPQWVSGGRLQAPRCGHAIATDCRTSVLYNVGGYGGGLTYHDTVETFDTRTGVGAILGVPMAAHRSGAGAACGPDGCLYVVGGSTDGSTMLASCERYDPRRGKWEALPPLTSSRGYLAATFGLDGLLYAAGGSRDADGFGTGCTDFSAFNPRRGQWEARAPMQRGRANLAAALVHH